MAVASTALLLRPLPSLDNQASIATASTASLVGSSSSHGSFCLFLHHRRPQRIRPAISRITPVQENLDEEEHSFKRSPRNTPPWEHKKASMAVSDVENPPPWLKDSSTVVPGEGAHPKVHTYRPAPWQQGSPSFPHRPSDVGPPGDDAFLQEVADSDKSSMARIVEKLRHIQRAYDPAQHPEEATSGTIEPFGGRSQTGPGRKDAMSDSKKQTERGRAEQRGKAVTKVLSLKSNIRDTSNGKNLSMYKEESLVLDIGNEGSTSRFPWERDEQVELEEKLTKVEKKGPRVPTLAELTLPREELKRLRIQGLQLEERLRIGKLGVTRNIVISIQEQFRSSELVKVRCEGPAAANVKKTHLDLEGKTGGLVVLRTGKIIVLYRGSGYEPKERIVGEGFERKVEDLIAQENRLNVQAEIPLVDMNKAEVVNETLDLQQGEKDCNDSDAGRVGMIPTPNTAAAIYCKRQSEAEAEAESLLEGLGPRFEDWTGLLPVPIDADLLPPAIPNYRPPFRLMPHGVKPRISDGELTNLRRLARPIAPHFVLSRNRGHQGLAAAMVKLWEKSEVAKIAIKRRVQNTNNLIMADELKRLTGGILLSRDKFFLTFYRGKDFLPEKVADALAEREASVRTLQELEEKAREERSIPVQWTPFTKPSIAVIGKEAPAAKPSWMDTMDVKEQNRLKREVAKLQRLALTSQLEKKLSISYKKKKKAEDELKKLDVFLNPIDRPVDVETITEEERFMFRKLGLKMKAYLLIGRRGVFDGVVENMHLHWKHRELVKIVVKEVDVMEVQDIARTLENESGGILVAIVGTRKGQAIIMYRGKNYQRPLELRPRNLLTKRKALKRSLEMQRHEALSKNIKSLEDQILSIQAELRKLNDMDAASSSGSSEGANNRQQDLPISGTKSPDLVSSEKDGNFVEGKEMELERGNGTGSILHETEMDQNSFRERINQLEMLVRSGPLYRADPLSNSERLQLRKEALSSGKAPPFFVGQNNGLEGLARGIRIYFLHNHLAKIVVKGRSQNMLMEDLVHDLEELTGGVLVSREGNKIIMYRGWPEGHRIPFAESLGNITPELLSALEAEEDWEGDADKDHLIRGEAEETESELEEEDDEWMHASTVSSCGGHCPLSTPGSKKKKHASTAMSDAEDEYGSDQMAIWEDIDEGSDEDSCWEDDEGEVNPVRSSQLQLHHNSEEIDDTEENEDNEEDSGEDSSWDVSGEYDAATEQGEDEDDLEEDEDEVDSDQHFSWDLELEWDRGAGDLSLSNQKLSQEAMESW